MNGERFDELARNFARIAETARSRRCLLRAAVTGAAMAAGTSAEARSAPDRRSHIRAHNQEAGIDPEIDELAFELDYDPDRIFAFIRDEVSYDPYPGVLRGPRGALWGLSGNAADQAMLLAALLNASLVETRFRIGQLSDEVARRLLNSAQLSEAAMRRQVAKVLIPQEPTDAQFDLSEDEVRFVQELPGFAERFQNAVARYRSENVQTVVDALTEAGIAISQPPLVLPDLERRQHVWVQYARGTDWVDLDPSIADAQPGETFGESAESTDTIANNLYHQVTFRLVAEQIVGGSPTRQELLTYSATSADMVGIPLTLIHPQPAALKAIGQAVTGEVGGFRNFMPMLLVGEEPITGRPVTFSTGDGVFTEFEDSTVIEGDTIAEWLEVTIHTPDGDRQLVRELFDRIGYAERKRSGNDPATIQPVDFADTGDTESTFLPLAGLWSILVVSGPTPARSITVSQADEPRITDFAQITAAFHYSRDVFSHQSRPGDGTRTFLAEPNVTATVLRPTRISGQQQSVESRIDLLYRSTAAIDARENAEAEHPLIAAGALGHAVERTMVEASDDPLFALPIKPSVGAGRVFEAARDAGIAILALGPSDDQDALSALSDEARFRIAGAMSNGFIVVVPERPVLLGENERSGWWLIDPDTGATHDQMDDGGGTQIVEYILAAAQGIACGIALISIGVTTFFVALALARLMAVGEVEASGDAESTAEAIAAARSATGYGVGSATAGGNAALICAL